jgi:hypothetical protein
VLDIRVPNTNGKKVYVSHAPPGNPGNCQTLAVNVNSVNEHLTGHPGDRLGQCGQSPCQQQPLTITRKSGLVAEGSFLQVTANPNPSVADFTLAIKGNNEIPVVIKLTDINGRIIEQKNVPAVSVNKIGAALLPGVYFAEIIQGKDHRVVKLIKL